MSEAQVHPKVGAFLTRGQPWSREMQDLCGLVRECGLREEFKWGWPCYAAHGHNIVLVHAFKEYCALLFFKGALMDDPDGLLIQQTENVQAPRQIRFKSLSEISSRRDALRSYIMNAVKVEASGAKLEKATPSQTPHPAEFEEALVQSSALQKAFEALTPGRQRAYLLHFAGAKQPQTRRARVDKSTPQILAGKGLDD